MNEALSTVNSELKARLEAISTAHNDLRNLMAATEIGTLILDPDLRIRLFTPAVAGHFDITEADIGRPITDFTHRLAYEHVEADARDVLKTLLPREAEVNTRDGQWLAMRLRPYRAVGDRTDGVVATFTDITDRKHAEDALADEMRAMARLQELSTRVIEADHLEAPLGDVLDAAIDLLRADFGDIQLFDHDAGVLRIAVHRGLQERFLRFFGEVEPGDTSACALALAEGRTISIEDVDADPRYAECLEEAHAAGYRAVQATPLYTSAGRFVGMLSTQFRNVRHFSDHDHRLMSICARQAADAINTHALTQAVRESEMRLRQVLETDTVGVLFFDPDGTLIDTNRGFLLMTGYTREQVDARELSWQKMTPPEWIEESERQRARLRRTGRIGPFEKEYFCADGSRKWMLFAGRRIDDGMIAEYALDIGDRKRAEEERELLARELSHRVKNTLAVVQALARQTRGATIEDFRETFSGRLDALAQAHSLLLAADWRSADLRELVLRSMTAYETGGERVRIDGAALTITARQALGISLVLHELATNALKYGALSEQDGYVDLSWAVEAGDGSTPQVRIRWKEHDGPPVILPGSSGFGGQLIIRAAEYDLEGKVEMDWAADGVSCEIAFPR